MTRVRDRFPRIPCLVPFCSCGATCYPPGYEIICPKHYRLVDRALKAARRRARAELRRRGEWEPGADGGPLTARARRLENRFWNKMKRQAITRAAGAPI